MENPPAKRSNAAIYGITAVLALAITGAAVWRTCGAEFSKAATSAALSMPKSGDPDLAFHPPSPWLTVGAPKAVRFDFPAGSENGALLSIDGSDIFGTGGPNMSLGDPVFAVADGKVIYVGRPTQDTGEVIVLAHETPDGKQLFSTYGSLHKSEVATGSLVARGSKIGVMGIIPGPDSAGLIFDWQNLFGKQQGENPTEFLKKLRTAPAESLAPSPLSKM